MITQLSDLSLYLSLDMKNFGYFALFSIFVFLLEGQLEAQENSTSNLQSNEPTLPIRLVICISLQEHKIRF